jgi:hypothetical protein
LLLLAPLVWLLQRGESAAPARAADEIRA